MDSQAEHKNKPNCGYTIFKAMFMMTVWINRVYISMKESLQQSRGSLKYAAKYFARCVDLLAVMQHSFWVGFLSPHDKEEKRTRSF